MAVYRYFPDIFRAFRLFPEFSVFSHSWCQITEGLFNNCLFGKGIAVLESPVPRDELIIMELTEPNDVVKIDGNMAIAWSNSLKFTVEKATKTLMGSAASGEGFVNVYRGAGKILMAPV